MKTSNQYVPYVGYLTPAQAAEGIRLAVENARNLLADAELLFRAERWQTATALAILAIEEGGKPSIMRSILLARNQKELQEAWKEYRTHLDKNAFALLPGLIAGGARKIEDMRSMFTNRKQSGREVETVKQFALYTGAYGHCFWSSPTTAIGKDTASTFIGTARLLVRAGVGKFSTAPELEIWVKHMKPVWKSDMNTMKIALVECYREAEEKGLHKKGEVGQDLNKFLFSDGESRTM
jgi:AbiV family abortive infection protein